MDDINDLIEQCRKNRDNLWRQISAHKAEIARLEKLEYIDEEKSVKWNREEKERLIRSEKAKLGAARHKYDKAYDPVVDFVKNEIRSDGFTEAAVDIIYDKAYQRGRSDGFSYVYQLRRVPRLILSNQAWVNAPFQKK